MTNHMLLVTCQQRNVNIMALNPIEYRRLQCHMKQSQNRAGLAAALQEESRFLSKVH
ncbi:UNVERIFIED_CONTAM: hypothetical protein FKN15_022425 [Acipenser sinensis]